MDLEIDLLAYTNTHDHHLSAYFLALKGSVSWMNHLSQTEELFHRFASFTAMIEMKKWDPADYSLSWQQESEAVKIIGCKHGLNLFMSRVKPPPS